MDQHPEVLRVHAGLLRELHRPTWDALKAANSLGGIPSAGRRSCFSASRRAAHRRFTGRWTAAHQADGRQRGNINFEPSWCLGRRSCKKDGWKSLFRADSLPSPTRATASRTSTPAADLAISSRPTSGRRALEAPALAGSLLFIGASHATKALYRRERARASTKAVISGWRRPSSPERSGWNSVATKNGWPSSSTARTSPARSRAATRSAPLANRPAQAGFKP